MRSKFINGALLVAALLVAGYLYNKYRIAPVLNFKEIQLTNIDGEKVLLGSYESRTLVVCFFATWCGPCMKEIPSLEKAQNLLNDNDVTILLISDESEATLNSFWQNHSKGLPVLRSVQKLKELKIATIPTTYVLNEKREVVYNKVGETDWASPDMIKKLKELSR
ncbi:MAG TPA: TlpA disulfide reductase family protein [Chitinophagales bacterium]|nr:TlpA disulfide reductase family protein [Chitinophagales bacterium]HLP50427.1 TlpA disulfide reductase family protein [Chitinophagales bacterium]